MLIPLVGSLILYKLDHNMMTVFFQSPIVIVLNVLVYRKSL